MSRQRSFSARFATVVFGMSALFAGPSLHAAPQAPTAARPAEAAAIPAAFTPRQIDALAALAKVWGFLKVHHPEVAAGKHDWDAELLRMLPVMLTAPDVAARNAALADWIARLGVPDRCEPCAREATEVQLAAPVGWIHDADSWGEGLSGQLQQIHRYRFAITESIYALPASALTKDSLSRDGLVWVATDAIGTLTLSGPHKRWVAELLLSEM